MPTLEAASIGSSLRLAEVLGALSLATDLANGQAPEQCLRAALVSTRLAADGDAPLREDIYWCAVLRYLGCNGFAVEEAVFASGDDIGLRASFVRTDLGRPSQFVGAVLRDVGRGAPLLQRAQGVARMLSSPQAPLQHARAQCDAGMQLARKLGMSDGVVQALGQADERFDGRGFPARLAGDALVSAIRHVELARVAVVFHALGGITSARAEVQRPAGGHLDPDLARRFDADAAALLAGLDRTSVWDEFLAAEPQRREVAADALEPLFEAFALFADMKSAYGHGHSTGVAALARAAAQAQGLPAAEATTLAHAALLHDLGRVCVPTGLWDNPGTLSAAEWGKRVRLHAYFTDRVLRQSPALSALAEIAGRAHEKLDGAGYPRGDRAPALGRAMRLLAAADVYHACTETRAHRPAHAPDAAARELAPKSRLAGCATTPPTRCRPRPDTYGRARRAPATR